jgi:dTDP-glucose 4,6-dehydratase
LARIKKVKAFLHTSSGAVYGKQPSHISHIHEEFSGTPDLFHFGASYAEGKRVAEMLSYFYYSQFAVPSKIARCFAFVGPHLPLDAHFAAGNFINNLLQEKNIEIKGDGTQFRSYLYASDLAIWLWTILFKGTCCTPYNVGSDEDLTIKELAGHIASFSNKVSVFVHQKEKLNNTERYVPAIERAKNELHLEVKINLKQALAKTIEFYKQENEKS